MSQQPDGLGRGARQLQALRHQGRWLQAVLCQGQDRNERILRVLPFEECDENLDFGVVNREEFDIRGRGGPLWYRVILPVDEGNSDTRLHRVVQSRLGTADECDPGRCGADVTAHGRALSFRSYM